MKSYKRGFGNTNLELNPYVQEPVIQETILQTLTRLLGYDNQNERFNVLLADTEGRLYVSTDSTKVSTGTISQLTADGNHNNVLAANPNRKLFTLINTGAALHKITFDVALTASNFFTLLPGGVYSNEIYTGKVYATGTIGDILQIIEY